MELIFDIVSMNAFNLEDAWTVHNVSKDMRKVMDNNINYIILKDFEKAHGDLYRALKKNNLWSFEESPIGFLEFMNSITKTDFRMKLLRQIVGKFGTIDGTDLMILTSFIDVLQPEECQLLFWKCFVHTEVVIATASCISQKYEAIKQFLELIYYHASRLYALGIGSACKSTVLINYKFCQHIIKKCIYMKENAHRCPNAEANKSHFDDRIKFFAEYALQVDARDGILHGPKGGRYRIVKGKKVYVRKSA